MLVARQWSSRSCNYMVICGTSDWVREARESEWSILRQDLHAGKGKLYYVWWIRPIWFSAQISMDDIILVILAIWLALKLEIISVALRSVICKVTFAKKQKQNKHKIWRWRPGTTWECTHQLVIISPLFVACNDVNPVNASMDGNLLLQYSLLDVFGQMFMMLFPWRGWLVVLSPVIYNFFADEVTFDCSPAGLLHYNSNCF